MDRDSQQILDTISTEEIVDALGRELIKSDIVDYCMFPEANQMIQVHIVFAYLMKRLKQPKLFKIADAWSTAYEKAWAEIAK